ncbi:MAG TPA: electron transport complex subunit RsxG [Gallionellaceae bacterium]|nr:electron transport complex subunit RsxG [Gallionellaceae bacterium]
MKELSRATVVAALNLLAFTIVGTAILAYAFSLTKAPIAKSEEAEKLKLITQLLPHSMFDNNVVRDDITLRTDPLLGNEPDRHAYRASLHGKPSAVLLETVAPDGYGGKIFLLVGVNTQGEIIGVRVISHNETPGLGDYIDAAKSNWIKGFDGLSDARYKPEDWQVKKDGGKFDYMAGATISPRAVIKAVHKALEYFDAHHDMLFAPAAPAQAGK